MAAENGRGFSLDLSDPIHFPRLIHFSDPNLYDPSLCPSVIHFSDPDLYNPGLCPPFIHFSDPNLPPIIHFSDPNLYDPSLCPPDPSFCPPVIHFSDPNLYDPSLCPPDPSLYPSLCPPVIHFSDPNLYDPSLCPPDPSLCPPVIHFSDPDLFGPIPNPDLHVNQMIGQAFGDYVRSQVDIHNPISNRRDSFGEDYIQEWPTNRQTSRPVYDVFINHCGKDTKGSVASLLHNRLIKMGITTFLDKRSMKPGDGLSSDIYEAILGCKVGVVVFSTRYCESYYCLHELALLMESKKRLVPIFYDVRPSQLQVRDDGTWSAKEFQRFSLALEKARDTVGLTFDSSTGDWSELLRDASDAVTVNLIEAEKEPKHK